MLMMNTVIVAMRNGGMPSMAGNKYGAKKIVDPATGYEFDSKKEFYRWCELRILERAGKIFDLQRQVKYELIPKQKGERAVYYIADFVYYENGNKVVEDCKGYQTEVFRLKKKLLLWVHGIRIKLT
jgi:hypothetical protein